MNKEKYNILWECLESDLVFEMWPATITVTPERFLEVISQESYSLAQELGLHTRKLSSLLDNFWPERPKSGSSKICVYILHTYNIRRCSKCNQFLHLNEFTLDRHTLYRLSNWCKICTRNKNFLYRQENPEKSKEQSLANYYSHKEDYLARNVLRKAHIKLATPIWADIGAIKEFYRNRPENCHVDHIIPLRGADVCGLHIVSNLQYLPAKENIRKSNKFIDL